MARRRLGRVTCATALALIVGALVAPTAEAAANCTFDPATRTLTIDNQNPLTYISASSGTSSSRERTAARSRRGLAGDDKLFGQDGNDILDGGLGTDLCHQGTGIGTKIACEP